MDMDINRISAALACPSRLSILQWLKAPAEHFPPQVHADIEVVGVCGAFFADKLGVVPATASTHLRILVDAGLIGSTRIGKWTYFKRNDAALLAFSSVLAEL
jgi:DNA-binding transcriptional ArsR family regulator